MPSWGSHRHTAPASQPDTQAFATPLLLEVPAFANLEAASRIRQEVLNSSPRGIASTIRAVRTKRPGIFQDGPKLGQHNITSVLVGIGKASVGPHSQGHGLG